MGKNRTATSRKQSSSSFIDNSTTINTSYSLNNSMRQNNRLSSSSIDFSTAPAISTSSGNVLSTATEKKAKTTGPIHNSKYKIKLCEKYESDGFCPYYEKCQFAHGEAEIEKWNLKRKQAALRQETTKSHSKQKQKNAKYSPTVIQSTSPLISQKQIKSDSLSYQSMFMPHIDLSASGSSAALQPNPYHVDSNILSSSSSLKPTTKPWYPKHYNPTAMNHGMVKSMTYSSPSTSLSSFSQQTANSISLLGFNVFNRNESMSETASPKGREETHLFSRSSPSGAIYQGPSSSHSSIGNNFDESSLNVDAIVRELKVLTGSLDDHNQINFNDSYKIPSGNDDDIYVYGQKKQSYSNNFHTSMSSERQLMHWETDSTPASISASASVSYTDTAQHNDSFASSEKISPFLSPTSTKSYATSPPAAPLSTQKQSGTSHSSSMRKN